ncbi:universal stress protein [Stenotrophomonas sp. DDT-1]|uniref:universal stress protein n=1 Tax=Stenotrophomonas sp. DDT-1 TaxID=1609637 RepID=UPI000AFC4FD4|nr:universal stress protein [Stenotrophomonas sp. DDT-1]
MYKDILLPFALGRVHEGALGVAVALARHSNARLVAFIGASIAVPIATGWMYYPSEYAALHGPAKNTVRTLSARMHERLAKEAAASEVRSNENVWESATYQTLPHARTADLAIVGLHRQDHGTEEAFANSLLLEAGIPIIFVPGETARMPPQRVLVAWKNTREATRAIHDALPILKVAKHVDILHVSSGAGAGDNVNDAAAQLLAHLQQHSVSATLVQREPMDGGTSPVILSHAEQSGADLIVAGAYGRSRASEYVFGGVTRTLLRSSPLPVLLSH